MSSGLVSHFGEVFADVGGVVEKPPGLCLVRQVKTKGLMESKVSLLFPFKASLGPGVRQELVAGSSAPAADGGRR